MNKTCFSIAAAFSLLVAASYADEPKGYRVVLPSANIGTSAFDSGEYRLLVHRDEPKIGLMALRNGDVIEVAGTVEDVGKKFDRTEIYSSEVDGVKQINEIRIGGTKVRIEFRKGTSAQ